MRKMGLLDKQEIGIKISCWNMDIMSCCSQWHADQAMMVLRDKILDILLLAKNSKWLLFSLAKDANQLAFSLKTYFC